MAIKPKKGMSAPVRRDKVAELIALAHTFPCLKELIGKDEQYNLLGLTYELHEVANTDFEGKGVDPNVYYSCLFILMVAGEKYGELKFRLAKALMAWGPLELAAFALWATKLWTFPLRRAQQGL